MALLDNGQDLAQCERELGVPVGQLLTPLTRYRLRDPARPWAIDNGGFKRLDIKAFDSLLGRESHHREKCLFVAAPDIVGSAQRTMELFDFFAPRLDGWSIAFVCQDGQELLPIPWDRITTVFIGGSTNWKCSRHVEQIVRTAKVLGKRTHAGRVNDPARWRHFEEMGVDTCDGTGLARYTHMREAVADRHRQGQLV
ncbi:hypothetical protein [Sphingopyxis sp. 550A]